MAASISGRAAPGLEPSYADACDTLASILEGPTRSGIVESALAAGTTDDALVRLRGEMRSHMFRTAAGDMVVLKPLLKPLRARTRRDGLQILRDWDGAAERYNKEIVAVGMLDYARGVGVGPERVGHVLDLLLDYYFLHVLALLVIRAWDEGDPDRNMDRVTHLLDLLQGPDGSGHQFLRDWATLLWLAISSYQPSDAAYDQLLEKVRALDDEHRLTVALMGAAMLGSHLRWGFEAYYRRSLRILRGDNFADYPWLLFSLTTLMERYDRMVEEGEEGPERDFLVGALLNGLTSDVPAFLGEVPEALSAHTEEHARFAALYEKHHEDLLAAFNAQRPTGEGYSPLGFHFNFPHNAVKGLTAMALEGAEAPNLPIDALLEGGPTEGEEGEARIRLAEALTRHSRLHPERLSRGRRVMVNSYSVKNAVQRFREVIWTAPGEGRILGEDEEAASVGAGDRFPLSPYQRGQLGPGSDEGVGGVP